ncbi:immunity 22 family protein [Neisseria sp. 23W00296]|uniref:immunity 22 family protein n=1 Tax=unclassified Neisseria TaxID=2623750 RepID=UPI003756335B
MNEEYRYADRFNTVHLWLGMFVGTQEEYERYFGQDDLNEGEICPFCRDIGLNAEYDEDYIGIIPLFACTVPLDELLSEAAVDADALDAVRQKCRALGLCEGNAVLWYSDPELNIDAGKSYNGLHYIGEFPGD